MFFGSPGAEHLPFLLIKPLIDGQQMAVRLSAAEYHFGKTGALFPAGVQLGIADIFIISHVQKLCRLFYGDGAFLNLF